MRIYLIFPDISSFHGLPYHPGLASIASILISKGHTVRLEYFDKLENTGNILKQVNDFEPHIIGFTAVETQFVYVKYLASEIKKVSKSIIICGGPYVTLTPEVILEEDTSLDAVIIGEGEHAVIQLTERLEKGEDWLTTNNLAYRNSETGLLVKNSMNPIIENLDFLPYPNTDLFPYQEIIDKENIVMFYFNRGCPYKCSYCSNIALGKVSGRAFNNIRYRSVNSVMDEIDKTLKKYKLRDDTLLHFGDDLFIFNKNWLREFCTVYKKRVGRPFWCTGRSNHITDEICFLLKDAGCAKLMMSVESGNDYIRNEVMLRNISRERLFKSFELCDKYGINTLATCIIGLPFETPEMIEDSIKTVARLKSVTAYGINIFYPYKGTHLRKICEEKGFMPDKIEGPFVERKESILNLPDLSKDLILYYYENWMRLIMKHKRGKGRLKYIVWIYLEAFRKTFIGQKIRIAVNSTGLGRTIKKGVMRYLWNSSF